MFLVSRCWVPGSRDSTTNSCSPFGSYVTCSQRQKRSMASPTASYSVRASRSTACSIPSESRKETRHCLTRRRIADFAFCSLAATPIPCPRLHFQRRLIAAQAHKPRCERWLLKGLGGERWPISGHRGSCFTPEMWRCGPSLLIDANLNRDHTAMNFAGL